MHSGGTRRSTIRNVIALHTFGKTRHSKEPFIQGLAVYDYDEPEMAAMTLNALEDANEWTAKRLETEPRDHSVLQSGIPRDFYDTFQFLSLSAG